MEVALSFHFQRRRRIWTVIWARKDGATGILPSSIDLGISFLPHEIDNRWIGSIESLRACNSIRRHRQYFPAAIKAPGAVAAPSWLIRLGWAVAFIQMSRRNGLPVEAVVPVDRRQSAPSTGRYGFHG